MKKEYVCTDGTEIFTKQGKKSENDFKIYTKFPREYWPHTLEYIGYCIRLKAHVEEINYPRERGLQGQKYLHRFIQDCIWKKDLTIKELCTKYKIPEKEDESKDLSI
jgi:hypothetical protein